MTFSIWKLQIHVSRRDTIVTKDEYYEGNPPPKKRKKRGKRSPSRDSTDKAEWSEGSSY